LTIQQIHIFAKLFQVGTSSPSPKNSPKLLEQEFDRMNALTVQKPTVQTPEKW